MIVVYFFAFFLSLNSRGFAKVPCDPESFGFDDSPKKTEAFGLYTFQIKNEEETGCAINVTYNWELYRVIGQKLFEIPVETEALRLPGKSKFMFNQVNMDKIVKDDGLPRLFALKVTLIPDPTHFSSYRIWIFGPDAELPNKLIISGGQGVRTHWLDGGSLWLNATGTEGDAHTALYSNPVWDCDPPFLGERPPHTLKWEITEQHLTLGMTYNCTVTVDLPYGKTESATQAIHIKSMEDLPQIEVRCLENCEPPNANQAIVLECICHSRCEDKSFNWTVRPYSYVYMEGSSVTTSPQKSVIKFNERTFPPGSTIDFIATLGDATGNYTIHFPLPKPTIEIQCIENCESFDPKVETKFKVNCSSECYGINYSWETRPDPAKPGILNPPMNDVITFSPNTFSSETQVKLRVLAGRTEAKHEFTMGASNVPVISLKCYSNCEIYDPRLPLELRAECVSNCTGEKDFVYRWTVSVPRPEFHWYEHTKNRNRTFLIPANTYRDTDLVDFWVYGGDGSNNTMVTFHVEKAEMTIECVENCESSDTQPNSHKPVKLTVKCTAECNNGPYTWWLEPPPGYKNYTATQVSEDGTFFTIPAEQYNEGDKVELSVTKGSGHTSFNIDFVKLKPKLEVRCLSNCIEPLNPLKDTVLTVDCLELCYNNAYEWRPIPKPDLWYEHFILSNDNSTLTVNRGTYTNSESVDFGVFTKNDVEEHLVLGYDQPPPKLLLKCVDNCNTSWVSSKTVLSVKCDENCDGVGYEWTINPNPDPFKWGKYIELSKDNTSLTIMPFTFKHGDKISFTVTTKVATTSRNSDDNRQREAPQVAELTVEFEELAPVLEIDCKPMGCNRTADRYASVLLTVTCIKHCNVTSYIWDITPLPNDFDWDLSTIRGIENKTLKILPNTFNAGDNITFSVSSGPGKFTANVLFKNSSSEHIVYCKENCSPSNPHKPVNLCVKCIFSCDHVEEYEWKFSPDAKGVDLGPDKDCAKILAESFIDGDIVEVAVKSGAASHSIKVNFAAPTPILDIVCFRNCKYDIKASTFFKVRCVAACYHDLTYNWTLTPAPSTKEIYFTDTNIVMSLTKGSYADLDKVNVTVLGGKGQTTRFFIFHDIKLSSTDQPFECDSLDCELRKHNWRQLSHTRQNKGTTTKVNCILSFIVIVRFVLYFIGI